MLDADTFAPRYVPPVLRQCINAWPALLDDKCPKCGTHLVDEVTGKRCVNISADCDFFITRERFDELTANMGEATW